MTNLARTEIDFAALLSAVKPSERTDQYQILAALFHLNAHRAPVTARQVSDLLKLHCGIKAPMNVSASLRAYTGYVEPVAKGPPLRWSLTAKGLDRLRDLSGLSLAAASDVQSFETDIGII